MCQCLRCTRHQSSDAVLHSNQPCQPWQQAQEPPFIRAPSLRQGERVCLLLGCQDMQTKIAQVIEPACFPAQCSRQDTFDQPQALQHTEVPVDSSNADCSGNGQVLCSLERIAEQPLKQPYVERGQSLEDFLYLLLRDASTD